MLQQSHVICIGMVCYDINLFMATFPQENSKIEISQLLESGGGPAANAAYLLAKWGVSCALAGLIGDDRYGDQIVAEFRAVQADLSMLEIRPGYPTPLSVILVNRQNGSRTIINRRLPRQWLNGEFFNKFTDLPASQSTHIYMGATTGEAAGGSPGEVTGAPQIMLFDGHEMAASLQAMERFPQAITVLDAGSVREGTVLLGQKVDYLVSSERFALQLSGLPDLNSPQHQEQALAALYRLNGRQVVITLGERGLIYAQVAPDGQLQVCAMPAEPVRAIDTTAAGDIFHGAFVYGLLRHLSFEKSLELATRTAAWSVQREGGRISIPDLPSLQKA